MKKGVLQDLNRSANKSGLDFSREYPRSGVSVVIKTVDEFQPKNKVQVFFGII